MIQTSLLRFSFDRKSLCLSVAEANKFYRTLYGYNNSSHFGRYHHWVKGYIDEIDGKKIASSMILIPKDNLTVLIKFLKKNGAEVQIVADELLIEKEQFEKIISMGKEALTPK